MRDGQLPGNILEKFENRHSSSELKTLDIPFDFAKPSALIKFLMALICVEEKDLILDFFAGSASTAHAALELSAETRETRPFICVQLPGPTGDDSAEAKAGYKTVSAIGLERIRRVAKKLSEGNQFISSDFGVRAFSLSKSNLQLWDGDVDNVNDLVDRINQHVLNIESSAAPQAIIYEFLLKSGFPLTTKVEAKTLAGKTVYSIEDGALLICLDKEITSEVINALADADPLQVICLDEGFKGNDQLKTNAVQTFRARAASRETEIVFRTV